MNTILRMTHQREIILQELGKCKNHPTADGLYDRVKKKLPRISLATVYRNLEILSGAGMIRKLEVSGRQKRFDWDLDPHDHIFCVQCHAVDNIDFIQNQHINLPDDNEKGYKVSGCRIEFFGICPKCQKRNLPRTRKKGDKKMACKTKGCKSGTLSDRQRQVLEVLAKADGVCGNKDIAATTSLEPKQISCQLTALKKKGYVVSPARCKYEITDDGKTALD